MTGKSALEDAEAAKLTDSHRAALPRRTAVPPARLTHLNNLFFFAGVIGLTSPTYYHDMVSLCHPELKLRDEALEILLCAAVANAT